MSERERAQHDLAAHLRELRAGRQRYFCNAPYGVIEGMKKVERGGYVRTITFGVARLLDAQVLIFRPDQISINGEGPLAHYIKGTYSSVDEVKRALNLLAGAPRSIAGGS